MKNINIGIIKDLIISILIVIAIVLIVSVIFYNKISLSRVIPEAEKFELSEEMKEEINQASATEEKEIVTKYYIDAVELKQYEKTNEYNKGKKNPFAVESDTTEGNIIDGALDNTTSSSTNFYEDDGTK